MEEIHNQILADGECFKDYLCCVNTGDPAYSLARLSGQISSTLDVDDGGPGSREKARVFETLNFF